MSIEESENQHHLDITSRLSFLREILLNQGLTSLGEDSKVDLNTARDLNDTRHNCRCGSVISIGSFDALLDTVFVVFSDERLKTYRTDNILCSIAERYSDELSLLRQLYPSTADFISKDVVGIGQFGEVKVVEEKHTGEIFAMKTIKKSQLFQLGPSVACFKEERDVMVRANKSPWIAKLAYSFQDSVNLYLIMTFYAGGDLLNVLEQFDPMKEDMARFYLSEISTAIHFVHEMGYIHRDVKPENVLVDTSGHIKLADFGSAAALTEDGRIVGQIPFPVGTPEYVAPEVLSVLDHATGSKSYLYGRECDWWSLGVLAYEMLVGRTPFESGSRIETHANIQNYKTSLIFPSSPELSEGSVQLITSLCTGIANRIGYYEIMRHHFFAGVEWDELLTSLPPYIPRVKGPDDVSNFDNCDRSMTNRNCEVDFVQGKKNSIQDSDLCFIGYSYLPLSPDQPQELPTSTPNSRSSSGFRPEGGVDELRKLLKTKERELDMSMEERVLVEKESDHFKTQVQDLRGKLESERDERIRMEERTLQLLEEVREGTRRVSEMREADAAQKAIIEQDVVIRQLSQEKELSMQRARRLEEELMLKKNVWDEQGNEMNELRKILNQVRENARVEALQYQERINKLAEEAHAHITELRSRLEVKAVKAVVEKSEDQLREARKKIAEYENEIGQEKELREAANTQLETLNKRVQELEEQQSKVSVAREDGFEGVKIQELEQELLEISKIKEELEASEFKKERELQDMGQELIETLSDRDHLQEELNTLTEDFDCKEKEFVAQKEMISQLEEELEAAKLHLDAYDEEITSRLEYEHKCIPLHPDGAQSDTESTVGIADRHKAVHEVRAQYQKQLSTLRERLEEEMKKHALTRDQLNEINRVSKKRTSDVERSLEHQKEKLTNNEGKYKENISTLEKRNQDLQNQYNKTLGKVAEMRRVQTTLEREIQQMKKQEAYKDELRSKLSSAALQEKIKSSEQEKEQLSNELRDAKKLNKDFEDSVMSLQTELRNLRSSSLKTESRLQQANQQLKADQRDIEELRHTVKTLEHNVQGDTVRNEEALRKELDELSGKLEHKTQRLEISEQELHDTKKTLDRAEDLYQVQIDTYKNTIEEEKRKSVSFLDKIRGLEVDLKRRVEETQSLQRKEIDLANQMLQLKQQIREKTDITQHKSQDAAKEHLNQLSQELAHEKASKEEAKIRMDEYKDQSESLRLEVKRRSDEAQKSNGQLNSLRAEYRALKDSELESSRLLNELKRKCEDRLKSVERCKRMEEERDQLKMALEIKNDEVCKLQTIENVKINEINKLQENLDQTQGELDSFREEVKKLQLERMETEQKMTDLRTTTSRHELHSAQWAGEESKLKDVISTQKGEMQKFQSELTRAADEVKKLKMVVRQLEKGKLSEPQRVLDLEDQITECNTRIQDLEKVREQYSKSKLEAENHARVVNSLREDNSRKDLELNNILEDKQGVEDRNKTLALQLDLQFEELQKAKEEATCLRIQMQQLMATKHKLTLELETLQKQLGEKTNDEAMHSNEEKMLKEQRYRIETQLQQHAKLINYLTDGKPDTTKWSAKMKRKEFEPTKDKQLRSMKTSKPSQILYPPKTNGSDSGVTSIESDHDPFTPPDQIEHSNIPHSSSAPPSNFAMPLDRIEYTPIGNHRSHGVIDKVKKTLSGRKPEAPSNITGSKQIKSKSLKEVTIPKIEPDQISPVSQTSNNTYSISSCSENDSHSKRTKDIDECEMIPSPPKKVCSDSASRIVPKHFFSTKICKSSTVCDACSLPIKFGEHKSKCAFCRSVVHPRCSNDYDAINPCQSKQPLRIKSVDTESIFDPIPACDWCKVLFWPTPRQVWERYFVVLMDDVLQFYTHQPDDLGSTKATRTLKLGPFERAELSVHKEYNRKRLNSFSNAQYACTVAIFFHNIPETAGEPEGVYIQTPASERKQFWLESLHERINLNRNSFHPFTVEQIFQSHLPLYFFSALPLCEQKFVLLAGYSALYVMSVSTWTHPWSPPILLDISRAIAPIYNLKLFPEMGLILMIAGKDRQIIITHLEPMVEYLSGIIRDKKKTIPKFIPLPNTSGCHLVESGKVNELPFLCSFHRNVEGVNNHLMTHHNVPSNYSKCPLQLWHDRPLSHCTSILATPWKFLIGSNVVLNYNPPKKVFRESQISMHDSENNDTKTLKNPIEILQLPADGEFLLVYSEMGVFISRQGSGIFVNEEVILWNNTPICAWIDGVKLFVVSLKKITVYHLAPGELPSNPSSYKFNVDEKQFLCYIPSIKSMVYAYSEFNSTFLISCKFMMNDRVKRTCSTDAIKSVRTEDKHPKANSMTDLPETVL